MSRGKISLSLFCLVLLFVTSRVSTLVFDLSSKCTCCVERGGVFPLFILALFASFVIYFVILWFYKVERCFCIIWFLLIFSIILVFLVFLSIRRFC